jgi:Fe-S cluster assembly ATP-binding protein
LQRLLEYIKPDYVHIMQAGAIVRTGDVTLADQLEEAGYSIMESVDRA